MWCIRLYFHRRESGAIRFITFQPFIASKDDKLHSGKETWSAKNSYGRIGNAWSIIVHLWKFARWFFREQVWKKDYLQVFYRRINRDQRTNMRVLSQSQKNVHLTRHFWLDKRDPDAFLVGAYFACLAKGNVSILMIKTVWLVSKLASGLLFEPTKKIFFPGYCITIAASVSGSSPTELVCMLHAIQKRNVYAFICMYEHEMNM